MLSFFLSVVGIIALIAASLIFILLAIGVAFTSAIYALVRRRWSALPRAFVVQMSAVLGAILVATALQLADFAWNLGWGGEADLIVGGILGLGLGILFGLAVNGLARRFWRWARPRCDPKLDPADEARHA